MTLKQLISDPEKFKRFRTIVEQHLQSKSFEHYNELGDFLSTSGNTLYQVMANKRNPPDILIYKFCEYFGYNPAYFFGREDKLTSVSRPDKGIQKEDLLDIQKLHADLGNAISAALNK